MFEVAQASTVFGEAANKKTTPSESLQRGYIFYSIKLFSSQNTYLTQYTLSGSEVARPQTFKLRLSETRPRAGLRPLLLLYPHHSSGYNVTAHQRG